MDLRIKGQMVGHGRAIFQQSNLEIQVNASIMGVLAVGHMWKWVRMHADNILPFNPHNAQGKVTLNHIFGLVWCV